MPFTMAMLFQLQLCQYKNDINSLLWRITRLHAYLQNRHLWKNVGGVDHHLTPPLKTQAFVFSSFQSWWQFFWETDNNNMSRGKKKHYSAGAFANVFSTVIVFNAHIFECVTEQSYLSSAPHSLCFCQYEKF